ncbi:MAG: putative selenium-dependent hydroxylase accessory protein YqeC [Acidimicrobiales bacterium]|nr:putative selenium-dependent hydroxylase accessory protein YqeC [Acidimicrobiales bacterium]
MVEPIAIGDLADSLELGTHELISLVGGGGKTTILLALGRQLEGTVVLTTTTKMSKDHTDGYPVLLSPSDAQLAGALAARRTVLVWSTTDGRKALGVQPQQCGHWFGLADHVVVEADGARRRPLTAPGPLEPVVPELTTLLVACVGADSFGRVIADQCHRPMRVAAAAGCSPYQRLSPERLAKVLLSERGLQKDRPAAARFAIVATKVTEEDMAFAEELVEIIGDRAKIILLA